MNIKTLTFTHQIVVRIQTQRVSTDQLRDMLVRSPQEALRWIEAAAKAGLEPAQIVWGQILLDGHGVVRNANAALAWFETAAASGALEACNMVGRCYEHGWGIAADAKRAIEFFEIASRAGHLWGQVNLAQMLMRQGDPADRHRCFALFKAAAEGGAGKANIKAMNSLARFLEEGWVGPPDPASAESWYLKAAHLDDHWAQYNLATIRFGQGDYTAADRWLRKAVANSDHGFCRRVAPQLLARPEPVLRQRGMDALARCAESKTPEDLSAYRIALEQGAAVLSDPTKAFTPFKLVEDQGRSRAAAQLPSKRKLRTLARLVIMIHALTRRLQIAATQALSLSKETL